MSRPTTPPPFGRVLTAMVTPFTSDGGLDVDGAQRLATHLVERGCDGLVISGTTGESPTTSDAEKDTLLRAVLDAVGDRAKVVAGVGTHNTAHSVESAERAQKAGAHGLLAVTPYYNKPPQAGLVAHFTAIADATDLPVMLYDIPGRSVVAIATDTLLRLSGHERIVAVKDAKGDLAGTTEVLAKTDLAIYAGDDIAFLPWLAMGAVGVVSVVAHVCAPEMVGIVEAVAAGDLGRAQRLNGQIFPAIKGLMTRTQGAIATKAALNLLGLPAGPVRPPLVDATDSEIEVLCRDLAEAGIDGFRS